MEVVKSKVAPLISGGIGGIGSARFRRSRSASSRTFLPELLTIERFMMLPERSIWKLNATVPS